MVLKTQAMHGIATHCYNQWDTSIHLARQADALYHHTQSIAIRPTWMRMPATEWPLQAEQGQRHTSPLGPKPAQCTAKPHRAPG